MIFTSDDEWGCRPWISLQEREENKAPANSVSLSAVLTPCEMLRRRMTRQMFAVEPVFANGSKVSSVVFGADLENVSGIFQFAIVTNSVIEFMRPILILHI